MDYTDLLNKPYLRNGRGPDNYDCWGLVMEMYRRMGIELFDINKPVFSKREIILMMKEHEPLTGFKESSNEPKEPGVFYDRRRGHIGIMIGKKHVLHAVEPQGVVVFPIDSFLMLNPNARYYEHCQCTT
jgi:hypothetical protein